MPKRNGEIDLLRFVFCIVIVIHHFNAIYGFNMFSRGYIAVEFFFLVSGYLMAKHAERIRLSSEAMPPVGDGTWKFIIGKIRRFYAYYICAILTQVVVRFVIINHMTFKEIVKSFLGSIPTFTLTFFGLSYSARSLYVGNTWYLSVMIICMFLLYPLLLKSYDTASKVVFPLLAVFLLGYLFETYHSLAAYEKWNGFCYEGILRGLGEMALGASLCPLSGYLTDRFGWLLNSRRPGVKILFTGVKLSCYAVVLVFAWARVLKGLFNLQAFLFCAIGVLLSFSNAGYTIPDSAFTRCLGRLSLPIYIFHGFIRWSCRDALGTGPISGGLFASLILMSIVLSVLLMALTDLIVRLLGRGWVRLRQDAL